MNRIKSYISQEIWSPYVAGILLGIIGLLAVLLADALLGASGAFESIVGWIGKMVAPGLVNNVYWGLEGGRALPIMRPEITFSVVLLVGVVFGGTLGSLTSRSFKFRFNDDVQWKRIFGPQPWKRWVIRFLWRNRFGIRSWHCRWLHQRIGHFGWHAVCASGFLIHGWDVCLRHHYHPDRLSQELLSHDYLYHCARSGYWLWFFTQQSRFDQISQDR